MGKTERPSELLIEQFALGEALAGTGAGQLEAWSNEEEGRETLEALAKSNQEILAKYPPRRMASAIRERTAVRRDWTLSGWVWSVSAAAAAALVLLVVAPWDQSMPGGPWYGDQGHVGVRPEVVRIKGDTRLLVHLVEGETSTFLESGDKVQPGDLLQLEYVAERPRFGVVISRDGNGVASLHFPVDRFDTTELEEGGPHPLPRSYQLDDAPQFETFYFFHSDKALDAGQLFDAVKMAPLKSDSAISTSAGVEAIMLILRKDANEEGR